MLAVCLVAGSLTVISSGGPAGVSAATQARPNVIVVETDDQNAESVRDMPNVQSQIVDKGVTFKNNFVNFSDCCPSRATFMTGQYAHNSRILGNSRPKGGFRKFQKLHGGNNLAVWLQKAGYKTALVGKYLNGFGARGAAHVPKGWNQWYSGMGPTTQSVYDYDLDQNGRVVHYGTDVQDFKQDVFTEKAVGFVRRAAPARKPFFLWLTYTAPHNAPPNPNPQPPGNCFGAAKPAPRHADAFDSAQLPERPNFNEADVSDKPQQVRRLSLLDSQDISNETRQYRCQLEALQSVDEGVDAVLDQLRKTNELRRTYVVFTDDNGYFYGEHRIRGGKGKPYEESIRVPLAIRGPHIPHGKTSRQFAINADMAPTISAIAHAKPRVVMDGRSLLPFARHPGKTVSRELSIEAKRFQATRGFDALRMHRWMYAHYDTGEKELYDLKKDPFELENVHGKRGYRKVERRLARRLRHLRHCAGKSCRLRPKV